MINVYRSFKAFDANEAREASKKNKYSSFMIESVVYPAIEKACLMGRFDTQIYFSHHLNNLSLSNDIRNEISESLEKLGYNVSRDREPLSISWQFGR
jgi:hypothetical protein